MTSTQTSAQDDTHMTREQFMALQIPSPDELYDSIMKGIEPELVRANLDNLDALYAADTPAEKEARGKRYDAAFDEYEKQLSHWMSYVHQECHFARKQSRAEQEQKDVNGEKSTLDHLLQDMQSC
jgi:hypothetical protein